MPSLIAGSFGASTGAMPGHESIAPFALQAVTGSGRAAEQPHPRSSSRVATNINLAPSLTVLIARTSQPVTERFRIKAVSICRAAYAAYSSQGQHAGREHAALQRQESRRPKAEVAEPGTGGGELVRSIAQRRQSGRREPLCASATS